MLGAVFLKSGGEKLNSMNLENLKFRAKSIDNDKWFFGFLSVEAYCSQGTEYTIKPEVRVSIKINPNTIGQFTGLKDKNGIEIYKGDILKTETDKPMVVGWSEKFASFVLNCDGWAFSHWFGESCNPEDCEVIGNIHDNKILIGPV